VTATGQASAASASASAASSSADAASASASAASASELAALGYANSASNSETAASASADSASASASSALGYRDEIIAGNFNYVGTTSFNGVHGVGGTLNVTGTINFDGASVLNLTTANLSDWPVGLTVAELGHLSTVTANVQDQIDGKAQLTHSHAISDVTNLQTTLTGLQNGLDTKASLTGTETLTNKTLGQSTSVSDGGTQASSSFTLSHSGGLIRRLSLTGSITVTVSLSANGEAVSLLVDGNSHAITWVGVTEWLTSDGLAPALYSGWSCFTFIRQGGTIFGAVTNTG
jgi:hypothetical protein